MSNEIKVNIEFLKQLKEIIDLMVQITEHDKIKECKDKIDKLELSQSDIKISNIKSNNIKRELINYAEETINGIACNKHKWACKRFLDDLKDKNLFFDEEEVRRVYEWATHLHHIVGPLAVENIELNDISKFVI